jgi:hypothetical protein
MQCLGLVASHCAGVSHALYCFAKNIVHCSCLLPSSKNPTLNVAFKFMRSLAMVVAFAFLDLIN